MPLISRRFGHVAAIAFLCACRFARAEGERPAWHPDAASKYLDERATAWFAFDERGEPATRSTCLSCHTALPYLLARPALRNFVGSPTPTEQEKRLLAQTRMRVEHWADLDTRAFGLFYDDSHQKKQQSWGTEAVFNALILALDDRSHGRSSPSEATKQAFTNLWQTQARAGEHRGSWDWLDFNEPPWGSSDSRYFGAAVAAIAVGTAPGYPGTDEHAKTSSELLVDYLRNGLARQSLHHQAWALWAASTTEQLLTKNHERQIIVNLLKQQRDDGGWSLSSLGSWVRNDGTAQETKSDGYATGLVLHVVQLAGVLKSDAKVAKGLEWLKSNQAATGEWRGVSVTKQRDPSTHVGKFMSDAATAFAALALGH